MSLFDNEAAFDGKYTKAELDRIMGFGARDYSYAKPDQSYFKKSAMEHGPSWAEKREFVHWLIHDSTISPVSKNYLKECDHWVPKYQMRGFKYGLVTSAATFAFFPVIRKQTFARRLAFSMVPMAYFMRWGYVWGHENWWRRAKEVIVTYEIYVGSRSKITMK